MRLYQQNEVDRLVARAIATEREACAKVCEAMWYQLSGHDCAEAIRARGAAPQEEGR